MNKTVERTIKAEIQALRWQKARFLLDLQSIPLSRRGDLPKVSAIYFAYALDSGQAECLYIGQSRCLYNRWFHSHEKESRFDDYKQIRIAWIECPNDREERLKLEDFYIKQVEPIFNGNGNTRTVEKLTAHTIEKAYTDAIARDYQTGKRAHIKIGCIGHETEWLGDDTKLIEDRLHRLAIAALEKQIPDHVVSAVTPGWSMAIAKAARSLGIPLIGVTSSDGHMGKWSDADKKMHRNLMNYASQAEYSYIAGNVRQMTISCNRLTIKKSDRVLALWDGCQDSGTACMMNFAQEQGVEIVNLWRSWVRHT